MNHRALIFAIPALLCGLLKCPGAQILKRDLGLLRSFSGQFVVRATPADVAPKIAARTNDSLLRLEPTLVTVSCERIKQLLYRELNAANSWQAKIFIALVPATPDGQVTIMSERFPGSWQYRLELPQLIERGRYTRAIVQVLLLEFANRTSGGRSAEIPVWLSEGIAQYILASNELEIILPPPRFSNNGGLKLISANLNGRRNNPTELAFAKLKSRSPLSFYSLSWPGEGEWLDDQAEVFRNSAQLFIDQLLEFKDGHDCLRSFVSKLSERLNWQLAFLDSFHPHFSKVLDVEKWWALQIVHLSRRDIQQQRWSFEESRQKLDETLHASMLVHTGVKELPIATTVSLGTVIRDSSTASSADSLSVKDSLVGKVHDLALLRSRIAPELIPLLDKYRQVLDAYIQRLDKSGKNSSRRSVQETMAQLEELDGLRALVQPQQKAVASRKP